MTTRTLQADTVAEAYLELLRDRGIEYFLGNAGTDFASLVDAFAKFEAQGKGGPTPLVIPHEMVAVSMAHGYYLGAGRPAAVMVHVNVGTSNAARERWSSSWRMARASTMCGARWSWVTSRPASSTP